MANSSKSYAETVKNIRTSEGSQSSQAAASQTATSHNEGLQPQPQLGGNDGVENVPPTMTAKGTRRGQRAGFYHRRNDAEQRVARILGHLMNVGGPKKKRGGRGGGYERGRGGGYERGRGGGYDRGRGGEYDRGRGGEYDRGQGGVGNRGGTRECEQTQGSNNTHPETSME